MLVKLWQIKNCDNLVLYNPVDNTVNNTANDDTEIVIYIGNLLISVL